jgi:hypothetical protein
MLLLLGRRTPDFLEQVALELTSSDGFVKVLLCSKELPVNRGN